MSAAGGSGGAPAAEKHAALSPSEDSPTSVPTVQVRLSSPPPELKSNPEAIIPASSPAVPVPSEGHRLAANSNHNSPATLTPSPDSGHRSSATEGHSPNRAAQRPQVYTVALTGGPCAGKSTALARLSDQLNARGYHVYLVPEAATILLQGGARIYPDRERLLTFERTLIETQMALEDRFKGLASSLGERAVIVCDRGVMDNQAYVGPELWEALLDEKNWSVVQLRDRRYDGVIHMVTAAQGAEKFYTTENNKARTETIEQAREIDAKIIQAWLGHPRHRIVTNTATFEHKVSRVIEELCDLIGAPLPGSIEHRYLLKVAPIEHDLPTPLQVFDVTIDYLPLGDGVLSRLEKRTQQGSHSYTISQRRVGDDPVAVAARRGGELICEAQLTAKDYLNYLDQRDTTRPTVKKQQKVFTYKSQIWIVNEYTLPHSFTVLEVHGVESVTVPPFCQIERDVSRDPAFSSAGLSSPLFARNKSDLF